MAGAGGQGSRPQQPPRGPWLSCRRFPPPAKGAGAAGTCAIALASACPACWPLWQSLQDGLSRRGGRPAGQLGAAMRATNPPPLLTCTSSSLSRGPW